MYQLFKTVYITYNMDTIRPTSTRVINKKSLLKNKPDSNPSSLTSTKIINKESISEDKTGFDNSVTVPKTITEKKYILQPSTIPTCINLDILREYVKTDINNNREFFDDMKLTYKISSPTKAEWILNKAVQNGKMVGSGNNSVDISADNVCIDATVLTLTGSYTNEKGIMQNFSTGNDLDLLFNNNEGDTIIDIFKKKLNEKYVPHKKDEIYYAVFVCHNENVYLTFLKLIPENIDNMKCISFSKLNKTILIDNFIDKSYGNVKLYKSKKRLELRLCKDIINFEHSIKIF